MQTGNTWEPALNVCIRTLLSALFQTIASENLDPSKTGAGTDPSNASALTSAHELTPPSQTRVTEKLDPSNTGEGTDPSNTGGGEDPSTTGELDPSIARGIDPSNAGGVGQRCREAVGGGGGEGGKEGHLKNLGHMKYLKMAELLLEEVKLERKGGGGRKGLECDVNGCDVEGVTPLILVCSCAAYSIPQGTNSQKFQKSQFL
jgi:hypothetical protein